MKILLEKKPKVREQTRLQLSAGALQSCYSRGRISHWPLWHSIRFWASKRHGTQSAWLDATWMMQCPNMISFYVFEIAAEAVCRQKLSWHLTRFWTRLSFVTLTTKIELVKNTWIHNACVKDLCISRSLIQFLLRRAVTKRSVDPEKASWHSNKTAEPVTRMTCGRFYIEALHFVTQLLCLTFRSFFFCHADMSK